MQSFLTLNNTTRQFFSVPFNLLKSCSRTEAEEALSGECVTYGTHAAVHQKLQCSYMIIITESVIFRYKVNTHSVYALIIALLDIYLKYCAITSKLHLTMLFFYYLSEFIIYFEVIFLCFSEEGFGYIPTSHVFREQYTEQHYTHQIN